VLSVAIVGERSESGFCSSGKEKGHCKLAPIRLPQHGGEF